MEHNTGLPQKRMHWISLPLLGVLVCAVSLVIGFRLGKLYTQHASLDVTRPAVPVETLRMLPGGGTPLPAVGSQEESQYSDSRIEIHASPDGSLAFYTFIYNPKDPMGVITNGIDKSLTCSYGLTRGKYNNTDESIFSLVGTRSLACSFSKGFIEDGFKKWLTPQMFVLQTDKGVLKTIDVAKKTVAVYSFNPAWNFIDVTQDGKYYLFETKPKEAYVLLDQNKKVINDKLTFPPLDGSGSLPTNAFGQPEVVYDGVNNGFLFATYKIVSTTYENNYPLSNIAKKFDFYSMNDLSYRTLLTTDPSPVGGHGCSPFHISSTRGVIILDGGCPADDLDPKYLSSDHFLHLKLE